MAHLIDGAVVVGTAGLVGVVEALVAGAMGTTAVDGAAALWLNELL